MRRVFATSNPSSTNNRLDGRDEEFAYFLAHRHDHRKPKKQSFLERARRVFK